MAAVHSPEQIEARDYVAISLLILSLATQLAHLLFTGSIDEHHLPFVLLLALTLLVAWVGSVIVFGSNLASRDRPFIFALVAVNFVLSYLKARQPDASAVAFFSCMLWSFRLGMNFGMFLGSRD
ncbi:hypothetical protein BO86DRAFT_376172 [Aspergillus japonicus CBS 114.51]|uniref:Uncharacterized protein n=1 Tax=Aspergillus japonicus CBS 114.51 TaxID=1448312 RepID=A0A8T8XCT2_ASPJA|nr:hypothetical protein BO86DRAFT_376172 [Aspergillus japonicus CBS 114.51]RAH85861.1 hypothetical protein BO86DRAFT_376172 [Aspergillus japonicus CBS 114.51]